MERAFKAIDTRASQSDLTKAFEALDSLNQAVLERASQADMERAFKAIDTRASQSDLTKAFEALDSLNQAVQERASLEEAARLAASIADEVGAVWRGIEDRDRQIAQDTSAIQSLHTQTAGLQAELKELRSKLLTLDEQIRWAEEKLRAAPGEASPSPAAAPVAALPTPSPATGVDPEVQRKLDLAYLAFQRLFRGDENELRARLGRYQPILREAIGKELPRVLDVACGDGIFLEVLGEQGWEVSGVDINEPMVRIAHQRGIRVERADAVAFLESKGVGNYDAITALQFVEHLPPEMLYRFLAAAYGRLQPGGVLLIETINPHTLKALHWFHLDLSHARLVYPEMLQLLCETAGFREISWHGINPVEPHERLGRAAHPNDQPNVDRLNGLLYGDQDYYLIARRPRR
jgi:O-antigen chain-terminating methyltransferase